MQSSPQRGLLAITSGFGEIFSTSESGKKAKSELIGMRKIKMFKFSQFANQTENRQSIRPYKKLKKQTTIQVRGLQGVKYSKPAK